MEVSNPWGYPQSSSILDWDVSPTTIQLLGYSHGNPSRLGGFGRDGSGMGLVVLLFFTFGSMVMLFCSR